MNQLSFSGEVTHAGLFISQSCPINHSQSWRGPRLHFVKRKRRLREVRPLPRGHTVRGSGGRGTHVFSIPNVITRTRTSQTPLCGRGGGACSCRLLQGRPQWQRAGYWGQPEEQVTRWGSGAGSSLSRRAISGGAWNTDSPWHRVVSSGPNVHRLDWEGVLGVRTC